MLYWAIWELKITGELYRVYNSPMLPNNCMAHSQTLSLCAFITHSCDTCREGRFQNKSSHEKRKTCLKVFGLSAIYILPVLKVTVFGEQISFYDPTTNLLKKKILKSCSMRWHKHDASHYECMQCILLVMQN